MRLTAERQGAALVVRLDEPRLDAAIALPFKDKLREVIRQNDESVVLDIASVTFLDSSGLGAVVAVMKMVGAERSFSLTGVTPNVARVLRLTRMDSVLNCALPPEEAEQADVQGAPRHRTA